jgi:hypothetical protein
MKWNLRHIRNNTGWYLANSEHFLLRLIPFRKKLGDAIQTEEGKKSLEELGEHIGASFKRFDEFRAELSTLSQSAQHWLADDAVRKLEGGSLMAIDGVQTMLYVFGTYQSVAELFDRYMLTEATFSKSMRFFMTLPYRFVEQGWMDEGEFRWNKEVLADPEGFELIVSLFVANEWARVLTSALPGRWTVDEIIDDVKQY